MRVYSDPRDDKWFRLGDITLCETCKFAIQLRLVAITSVGQVHIWVHFALHPTSHFAVPAESLWEAAERREPMERV